MSPGARLLRAVCIAQSTQWDPCNLLDVSDYRTLQRLLKRGGLPLNGLSPGVLTFLKAQSFVANEHALDRLLAEVTETLTLDSYWVFYESHCRVRYCDGSEQPMGAGAGARNEWRTRAQSDNPWPRHRRQQRAAAQAGKSKSDRRRAQSAVDHQH